MDDRSWYPLGRIVGGTAYPGLMATSYFFHKILNFFHFTIQVRNMCVFIAPIFAAATAIASYLLTYEVFIISFLFIFYRLLVVQILLFLLQLLSVLFLLIFLVL